LAGLREDVQWLARASDALIRYWQAKNSRKTAFRNPPVAPARRDRVGDQSKVSSAAETTELTAV